MSHYPQDALGRWLAETKLPSPHQNCSTEIAPSALTPELIADRLKHEQPDYQGPKENTQAFHSDAPSSSKVTRRKIKPSQKAVEQTLETPSRSPSEVEEPSVSMWHPNKPGTVPVKQSLIQDFQRQGYQLGGDSYAAQ